MPRASQALLCIASADAFVTGPASLGFTARTASPLASKVIRLDSVHAATVFHRVFILSAHGWRESALGGVIGGCHRSLELAESLSIANLSANQLRLFGRHLPSHGAYPCN